MTRALITNDDGIDSTGLAVLARAAVAAGLDVIVAAPSWDSSGASAALTGVQDDGRLRAEHGRWRDPDVPTVSVEAAPAMITLIALRGGFGLPPDLVLSGINHGRNTGAAVLHSGTVGAALTAANHGVPSLAVSIDTDSGPVADQVPQVVIDVIAWLDSARPPCALNLNLPADVHLGVAGLVCAPLSSVGAVQTTVTDSGAGFLHVGFEDAGAPEPGSDAALLAEGWAVVTPLLPVGIDATIDMGAIATRPTGSVAARSDADGVAGSAGN